MAVYKISAKKDSWTSGDSVDLYVPVILDPLAIPSEGYGVRSTKLATLQDFISQYSEYFDPLITVPCYSDAAVEFAHQLGFSNTMRIEYVDSKTITKFYVNSTDYLGVQFGVLSSYVDTYYGNVTLTSGAFTSKNSYGGVSGTSWLPYIPQGKDQPYYVKTTFGSNLVDDVRYYYASIYRSDELSVPFNNIYFYSGLPEYDTSDDPYKDGGYSDIGGGTGTFSGTGDSIEFPNLPTLSAVSTGFITLFNPSIAQMQSLATYMWSDVFDIGLYKTLFADPMDCILGCSIVPVAVPNGGTKTVNVGNVSTGISMTVAASQYVEVDCGTLNVKEFWGSYLDYDPYTKAEIYLPYCGTHALQVDDIMGKSVHVKYHVDILSGACCAYVKCGGSVMYSFVGQCSSSIPISANDWTNVVNGALTIAASVGSLIATGGASAPMAVGAAAAVTGTIYGGGIKQNVEKSGSMGGTGGMLAVQTPYLILTRPRQALPKKQNTYTGYPSFITTKLEDLKGYTEIDSIRITGVPATDAELNELESILKSGVIF